MKVFYSWESDNNHETHLRFIRTALRDAVVRVGRDLELDEAERPELDDAATGRKGAENIVIRLLEKISGAAVYVADITHIAVGGGGRLMPNPNVMYELGWATSEIGYERIILVMNDAEGFKPKDMPFDICQRPIITYSLKANSTETRRNKTLERLTLELAEAIKVDIADYREKKTAKAVVQVGAADPSDFSIWPNEGFVTVQGYGGNNEKVVIPRSPRAYLRISPCGWKQSVPSPDLFVKAPEDMQPEFPPPSARSGSFGRCSEGAVRYWMTQPGTEDHRTSSDLAVFFEETGELWVLTGGAMWKGPKGYVLDRDTTLQAWRKSLRSSMKFMDVHGAHPLRKVEAGVTGLTAAYLPRGYNAAWQSLKPSVRCTEQAADWHEARQIEFILTTWNKVLSAFAAPLCSIEDLRKLGLSV